MCGFSPGTQGAGSNDLAYWVIEGHQNHCRRRRRIQTSREEWPHRDNGGTKSLFFIFWGVGGWVGGGGGGVVMPALWEGGWVPGQDLNGSVKTGGRECLASRYQSLGGK